MHLNLITGCFLNFYRPYALFYFFASVFLRLERRQCWLSNFSEIDKTAINSIPAEILTITIQHQLTLFKLVLFPSIFAVSHLIESHSNRQARNRGGGNSKNI